MKIIPVSALKGAKNTDDDQHVLLGFDTPQGEEAAMAIPVSLLEELALTVICSQPKRERNAERLAIKTNWFDIGKSPDKSDDDLYFTLEPFGGGSICFRIDRTMAAQIQEVLNAHLPASATLQTPRSPLN